MQRRQFLATGFAVTGTVLSGGAIPTPQRTLSAQEPPIAPPPKIDAAKAPPLRVTIGKETTVVTDYLTPTGYPDYAAAINARGAQRSMPQTNLVVVLADAMGETLIDEPYRAEYFRLLGISPPKPTGKEFQDWYEYVKELPVEKLPKPNATERTLETREERIEAVRTRLEEEFDECLTKPWAIDEYPQVAAWLPRNETALKGLDRIDEKTTYFSPIIRSPDGPYFFQGEFCGPMVATRRIAQALIARAMLRFELGERDKAWRDLQTVVYAGRAQLQGPFLIDKLLASAYIIMAMEASSILALDPRTTAEELKTHHDEFLKAPKSCGLVDAYEFGERLFFMELVTVEAETGRDYFRITEENLKNKDLAVALRPAAMPDLDYDRILRRSNAHYDELASIFRMATGPEQNRRYSEYLTRQERDAEARKSTFAQALKFFMTREQRSDDQADRLWAESGGFGFSNYLNLEKRLLMRWELTDLAFRLAAYRDAHKHFPETLADLVPATMAKVPTDRFADDAELNYRSDGEDLLCYSVGLDGVDGEGRGQDLSDFKHDDLAIFTPLFRPKPLPDESETL